MGKCNSIEHDFHKKPNMYSNLSSNISNEQQLRLKKINEIKDYLLAEIRERELISKNLSILLLLSILINHQFFCL